MSAGAPNTAEPSPAFRRNRRRPQLARLLVRRRQLRAGIVQLFGVLVAVALAFAAPRINIGFSLASNRTIDMLISVGAGTVTFIGIVFSLLFLVVQHGSTTFTPRLNLFRDAPIVWRAFALYTAVVVYSFTAALVIGRDERTSGLVPIISVLGVFATIIVFRRLQLEAFRSIQLGPTLTQVTIRGIEVIDGLYPVPAREGPTSDEDRVALREPESQLGRIIRWPRGTAVLQVVDVPALLRAADANQTELSLHVSAGATLLEFSRIASVENHAGPHVDDAILNALTVGEERTFEQDPTLALRVLVDIALRALSPAINDPSTAVQAIDSIDGLLRRLTSRDLDVGRISGEDGRPRVTLAMPTWEDYVAVALDELIGLRVPSAQASRRLHILLEDLIALSDPPQRPALRTRLERLDRRDG